jgi:uncharacterized protein
MKVRSYAISILLCGCLQGMAQVPASDSSLEQWRRARVASLTADDGWLTVTGLFWLHEGSNSFGPGGASEIVLPPDPALGSGGNFELRNGKVTLHRSGETRELRPDTSGSPDVLKFGTLTLFVIERGGRYGIRLKDTNSPFRKQFTGLHYFPADDHYRVTARFVPDARKIPIPNILGQVEDTPSPGYVEFELAGQHLRLTPVEETPGELFFIFRDLTSGKETYGSGRFLTTPAAVNGQVTLDFNEAYNPPCAFTPYATCPLPPKENRLPVRIAAGELKYGAH